MERRGRAWRYALGALLAVASAAGATAETLPRVALRTSVGAVVIEVDAARAPATARNFLRYVRDGFYDGTVFHRVIDGFMIQGGGYDRELRERSTREPIRNEADNGLRNRRGTVAMARTGYPHSATAQFFINLVDNPYLDHRAPTAQGWGYAVFGRVVEGMDTVDRIGKAATGASGPFRDVPREPIVIESATVQGAESEG